MAISRKTDYALRAVRAIYQADTPIVNRRTISETENISINFLTSILSDLSRAGIVKITHGKNGGYSICADLKKYTLLDIIRLFENNFHLNTCLNGEKCKHLARCNVHNEFDRVQKILDKELSKYSIHDILCNSK